MGEARLNGRALTFIPRTPLAGSASSAWIRSATPAYSLLNATELRTLREHDKWVRMVYANLESGPLGDQRSANGGQLPMHTPPTSRAALQENQYTFPYHHICYLDARNVGRTRRHLSWGLEYLCYQRHVQDLVQRLRPGSVLEVGCGDGFFIGQLDASIRRRVGVDLSERAISFAKAFAPSVEFRAIDVDAMTETFDVVAAIEVLEHIEDGEVGRFLRGLARRTKTGGAVVITVPTTNVPLVPKHHRHYDLGLLERQLEKSQAPLAVTNVEYIFRPTQVLRAYLGLTHNRVWSGEIRILERLAWQYVWDHLRVATSKTGSHMVVTLKSHE
jgi:2-polyprenyl-3-methyl-5-hydroxy-6-metoxy-1,4-benzoquinol methylase